MDCGVSLKGDPPASDIRDILQVALAGILVMVLFHMAAFLCYLGLQANIDDHHKNSPLVIVMVLFQMAVFLCYLGRQI